MENPLSNDDEDRSRLSSRHLFDIKLCSCASTLRLLALPPCQQRFNCAPWLACLAPNLHWLSHESFVTLLFSNKFSGAWEIHHFSLGIICPLPRAHESSLLPLSVATIDDCSEHEMELEDSVVKLAALWLSWLQLANQWAPIAPPHRNSDHWQALCPLNSVIIAMMFNVNINCLVLDFFSTANELEFRPK